MNNTLFLTADERTLFQALPEALRDGWAVENVAELKMESPEDLEMRKEMFQVEMAKPTKTKQLENLADIAAGKAEMPPEFFLNVLFTMGVAGMTENLKVILEHAKNDTDVQGAALLSQLRQSLSDVDKVQSPPSV
jgi:hypothetical protein